MNNKLTLTILLFVTSIGCAANVPTYPVNDQQLTTKSIEQMDLSVGQFVNWGIWNLEIAADGSSYTITPQRYNSVWGIHLNAVKLLEKSPCADCLKISNIHLLANGDVAVDISIRHPFDNAICTGFDVRGIIMFPSSQVQPDNELRALVGMEPWEGTTRLFSRYELGDAELMNPDGFTRAFNPTDTSLWDINVEEGYPIFEYYPGKYASGENIGTVNAFKRYLSSEERHMFEINKTVTRTYVIRPPASGPIQACYAVYAHWAPPINTPVTNPLTDFGLDANSMLPYEFWVEQTQPLDPDAPPGENCLRLKWHMKWWPKPPGISYFQHGGQNVSLFSAVDYAWTLLPHPSGEPDTYYVKGIETEKYLLLNEIDPGYLPSFEPYLFFYDDFTNYGVLSLEWYILRLEIEAPDGHW
jgi:hypothetical protein